MTQRPRNMSKLMLTWFLQQFLAKPAFLPSIWLFVPRSSCLFPSFSLLFLCLVLFPSFSCLGFFCYCFVFVTVFVCFLFSALVICCVFWNDCRVAMLDSSIDCSPNSEERVKGFWRLILYPGVRASGGHGTGPPPLVPPSLLLRILE